MKRRKAAQALSIAPDAPTTWNYYWIFLGILIALYVIGFYYDIRNRDSFGWMDPGEYYQFAASIVGGFHDNGQFNVPTIFPFIIAPFLKIGGICVPSALWINIFFLIILCSSVRRLCQLFEIHLSPLLVALAILTSPLIIGLSRELYIEFPLIGMSAFVFALWFDPRRDSSYWRTVLFSMAFGFGFMIKTTFLFSS